MRPLISALSVAVLVIVSIGPAGFASAQGAGESTVVGFYGAPDAGPAPLEVHFHYFGEESVTNTITNWAWDFGDGATSNEDYTTHTYANPGTYTVSLTVTLPGGTKHTATRRDYIRATSGGEGPVASEGEAAGESEAAPEPAVEVVQQDQTEGQDPGTGQGSGSGAIFIHHSCGENWLNSGLLRALLAKDYIDDRNDITYGVEVRPDPGRPGSLGPVPGELTDMNHWILWFNDYLDSVRRHGCAGGVNRIVLFKSCFPNSHVDAGGSEPGDPFSDWKTLANYKAVYRHPAGPGNTYRHDGHVYRPLEDVFAQNPDTLFIPVTAPPECWQDADRQTAAQARAFNEWLKGEWLANYVRSTGRRNVAVFDWFDVLACPAGDPSHPNQLRADYGGSSGDSHPNDSANAHSTRVFATASGNFIDQAWAAFSGGR